MWSMGPRLYPLVPCFSLLLLSASPPANSKLVSRPPESVCLITQLGIPGWGCPSMASLKLEFQGGGRSRALRLHLQESWRPPSFFWSDSICSVVPSYSRIMRQEGAQPSPAPSASCLWAQPSAVRRNRGSGSRLSEGNLLRAV